MLDQFKIEANGSSNSIQSALGAIREHLGMEVAYVSRFDEDQSVMEKVDAPGLGHMIKPGDTHNLDDVYCRHILAGRLPQLMTDAADHELAAAMPITRALPIGAHMSVPITSPEGDAIGMFCCLSRSPNQTLNQRDLDVMRVFADMAAMQMSTELQTDRQLAAARRTIEEVLEQNAFHCVFQPIVSLSSNQPRGYEALCRFSGEPYRSPDKWFAEAHLAGLGETLELAVIKSAINALEALPDHVYLSLNASPATIATGLIDPLVSASRGKRLVLEITEHASVTDYQALSEALEPLRCKGVQLAIDDAGAGYASLHHILALRPDKIKLDMSLTRTVDVDAARRALTTALVFFSRETASTIIAEGIETNRELETLRQLGVPYGQGYLIGKPAPLAEITTAIPRGLVQPAA